MHFYAQWSLAEPKGWEKHTLETWHKVPVKPVPTGNEIIDNELGHVFALNCQGVVFWGYDHYAIERIQDSELGQGLRFSCWQDDQGDFAIGTRWATVFDLFGCAPDPLFGGQINTRQRRTVFAERNSGHPELVEGNAVPYHEFVPPKQAHHGIWLPDHVYQAHRDAQEFHEWREWV